MEKFLTSLLTILICCHSHFLTSQIVINEFSASNVSTYLESDFYNFSDWIEIKNLENDTVNLSGYFLTDDFDNLYKWQVPDGTFIDPGGLKLFIADEIDIGANLVYYFMTISNIVLDSLTVEFDHLNFSLSTIKDEIAFVSPEGIIIDSISYGYQLPDVSFGRGTISANQWFYFSEPTPGLLNNSLLYFDTTRAESPVFSIQGGIYSNSQGIILSTNSPSSVVHYTLDGSIPHTLSPIYSDAIEINSTSVLRARVYDSIYLPGPVVTNSYIINENSDLAIISVAMNPEFLWDDTIGIYVEGVNGIPGQGSYTPKNWNQDWERPVNVELFSPGDNSEFNVQSGIKIYGYASRKGNQKPFGFYMKKKYGYDYLDYQLFKDKPSKHYKRFVLRNRGQRTLAHLKLNDVMMQSVIADVVNADDQAYEPAILFLNGEYWGIYSIREKLDSYYPESNFGLNPDNIDFIEHGLAHANSGDTIHYTNLLNFLELHDMSDDENYNYIKTQIDIDEYINYQITEIYSSNVDWPANNIKYWRPKTMNGIWRWILYDIDNAFEFVTRNSLAYATEPNGPSWPNPPYSTFLFRKLLENNQFKYQFIQQFASHLNITFQPQRVIDLANGINQEINSEISKHAARWGTGTIMNVNSFANSRPNYMRSFIISEFSLSTCSDLTVNFNEDQGLIFISNVQVPDSGYTGSYFEDVPLQIKAISKPGYRFVEWVGISNNYSTSIIINGDSTISAIFEESTVIGDIYINEFMADNDEFISDPQGDYDDWIEIYNGGNGIVDVGGLFITDDLGLPYQYMIPTTQPDSTSIFPGEYLILWADKDLEDGVLHMNIKLSKNGEEIGLYSFPAYITMDTITFGEQISDVSYGRYPDGEDFLTSMWNPTPGQSNIFYLDLDVDIFLEGAFKEIEMHTKINENEMIPLHQPFNVEPWNYLGTENVSSMPEDVVDWVLVELRDTTDASFATPATIIARQAAFLLKDGSIVDANNNLMLQYYEAPKYNLFVVIYHRNHLAVMSANALPELDGIFTYNFTTGNDQAYGTNGQKEIVVDIWGMFSGDVNGDGLIDINDKLIWQTNVGIKEYNSSDLNLDTEIENQDKNDFWLINLDASSQVPQ